MITSALHLRKYYTMSQIAIEINAAVKTKTILLAKLFVQHHGNLQQIHFCNIKSKNTAVLFVQARVSLIQVAQLLCLLYTTAKAFYGSRQVITPYPTTTTSRIDYH